MTKAELYGSKVCMAMRKLPEDIIPLIIGYVLRKHGKYGLADLVEQGWKWQPQGVVTNNAEYN